MILLNKFSWGASISFESLNGVFDLLLIVYSSTENKQMENNQSQTKSQIHDKKYLQIFQSIEEIVFALDENNIVESVQSSFQLFEEESPYSFNLVVCRLVYSCFVSHFQNANIYFSYLKFLEEKEEAKINNPKVNNVIEVFAEFLISLGTQESNYLLENLIEQNFIKSGIVKNNPTFYFAHYQTNFEPNKLDTELPFSRKFIENIEVLKKNDWKLH